MEKDSAWTIEPVDDGYEVKGPVELGPHADVPEELAALRSFPRQRVFAKIMGQDEQAKEFVALVAAALGVMFDPHAPPD